MSRAALVAAIAVLLAGSASPAEEAPAVDPQPAANAVTALEQTVARLAAELAAVQTELAAVKRRLAEAEREAAADRLRQAAREAAAPAASTGVDTSTAFSSGERMQPQLNPELSVTGDVHLVGGDEVREELQLAGVELDLQSDLDPYTRMHVVVGFHGEAGHDEEGEHEHGGEVEEAYLTWLHLPGHLTLTAGKKRQQFGVLNRWHEHALDQADLPWVLTESFGEEGLASTGLAVDWLMPSLWAEVNELTVEVTDGDNEVAFAGADWEQPSLVARLKSYWDLSQDAYLELGLDAAVGAADPDGDLWNDFLAHDATYNWNPADRSVYREVTVRGMLLHARRELAPDESASSWGGYLYGQGKLSRRWVAGARLDWVEDQLARGQRRWGVTPYLTLWQSEFVRLRGQLTFSDDSESGSDRQVLLQATFSAGPHKHESY